MSLKSRFKARAAQFLQDNRRNPLIWTMARLARFYHDSWELPGYEFETNGEAALLRSLANEPIQTIFDVGANVGDWAQKAAQFFPHATIHAFEAVAPTYAILEGNLRGKRHLVAHGYGLSSAPGTAEITYYGADYSYLSTMGAPLHSHLSSTQIPIELRTGDSVVEQLQLSRIDLLKIDVEGMEHEVLKGFQNALASGRIGMIQFEHHPGPGLLKDFYVLLGRHGYRIGKIYSRYVDFREYYGAHERTSGPNYFAVPGDRSDLIARLSQGFASAGSRPA